MTPVPYLTESYKSNEDGRVYGKVSYAGAVIASTVEGSDTGFRNDGPFESWSRGVAVEHKTSISPPDVRKVTTQFVV